MRIVQLSKEATAHLKQVGERCSKEMLDEAKKLQEFALQLQKEFNRRYTPRKQEAELASRRASDEFWGEVAKVAPSGKDEDCSFEPETGIVYIGTQEEIAKLNFKKSAQSGCGCFLCQLAKTLAKHSPTGSN